MFTLRIIYITVFIFSLHYQIISQAFYRIKSDYTIKYKDPKGNSVMQLGVVYYDLNYKVIVMKNGFPVREIIAQKDTTIYQIRNNYIHSKSKAYSIVELSIFHLALTGQLEDYGLKKAGYQLENVKEDKGLLLTTWFPPENLKKDFGKILVSVKDKLLFGIVFLDVNEKIIAKHFFRDYTNINGFVFPKEVLRISYFNDQEIYNLTNYDKIIVNGPNEDEYYNFKVPAN
jgi:hypothetical protein